MVIHSLQQLLAPGCLPLFTSDGLNLYFYALTAHFGQWLAVSRRGRKVRQWQVAVGLTYGQVKKSYQRRKLMRVTQVMRLGTQADLKIALQGMGFSGRLNTAFIERVARAATRARWEIGAATLPATYPSHGSGENQPTMDSAGCALLSFAAGSRMKPLRVNEARRRPVKWLWVAW